jgi:transposase
VTDCLAVIDGLAPVIERIDDELHQHARADPRIKVLRTLPGVGEFTALVMVAEIGDITRFGSARKLASWAGLTPTVRGSDLKVPAWAHLQAGLSLATVGAQPGRADRQAVPGLHRQLRGHRQTAREEDRHHRDRPQAGDPRLAPAVRDGTRRCQHAAAAAVRRRVAKPRVSSLLRHEPAPAPRSIT